MEFKRNKRSCEYFQTDSTLFAEEDEGSQKPPKSAETSRSAKTLQERAAARHSAKMDKSRLVKRRPSPKVIKLFSCSTQLSMNFP